MRSRNSLLHRKPDHDTDPYWRGKHPLSGVGINWDGLVGDLNRMERDYLIPVYPQPPAAVRAPGSSPAEECATATGVPVDLVRKVLAYVLLEQR